MPEREHSACLGKHPRRKFHRIRASAGMLDSLDGSDDMRPAELPDAVVKRLIGRVHVRAQNSLVLLAQDLFEDLCPPRCGYMVVRYERRDDDPEPAPFRLLFPSGLVDVEDRLFRQRLICLFMDGCEGFGDLLMELAD